MIPLYPYSFSVASDRDEVRQWRESYRENIRCQQFLDKRISELFDGWSLHGEVIDEACAEFGIDRVGWIFANTIAGNDFDGRYRQDNKIWAKTAYSIPDEDTNVNFELRSHPEIVNGLASQFRDYLLEQDYLPTGQRQRRKPREILQLRFYTKAWRCPSAELQVRFSWRCGRKSGRCLHAVQYTRASRNLPGTFTLGFGCD